MHNKKHTKKGVPAFRCTCAYGCVHYIQLHNKGSHLSFATYASFITYVATVGFRPYVSPKIRPHRGGGRLPWRGVALHGSSAGGEAALHLALLCDAGNFPVRELTLFAHRGDHPTARAGVIGYLPICYCFYLRKVHFLNLNLS
jgi:hypothetical protein